MARGGGATADPAEIRADFARWPKARIGIPTGIENMLVVIETDTIAGGHAHDGEPELKKLEAKYGPLPQQTRRVLSPSGSKHGYFQHPGNNIKIVSRTIAPGVDCKGDGGMVIGAGSVNPDGRAYRLIDASPPAPLPEAWINFLKFKPLTISQRAVAAIAHSEPRSEFDAPSKYGRRRAEERNRQYPPCRTRAPQCRPEQSGILVGAIGGDWLARRSRGCAAAV
jgi:hypothetical protein